MGKAVKKKRKVRAEPIEKTQSFLCSVDAYETLCCTGYTGYHKILRSWPE